MASEVTTQSLEDQQREVNTSLGNIREVDSTTGSQVTVTGATALSVSTDTPYTFASPINHVWIQNNSVVALTLEFDAPATSGSWSVPAGGGAIFDCELTVLHLFCASALTVNGTTASGVVLKGWL